VQSGVQVANEKSEKASKHGMDDAYPEGAERNVVRSQAKLRGNNMPISSSSTSHKTSAEAAVATGGVGHVLDVIKLMTAEMMNRRCPVPMSSNCKAYFAPDKVGLRVHSVALCFPSYVQQDFDIVLAGCVQR